MGREGLDPATSGFRVRRPKRSSTLPPLFRESHGEKRELFSVAPSARSVTDLKRSTENSTGKNKESAARESEITFFLYLALRFSFIFRALFSTLRPNSVIERLKEALFRGDQVIRHMLFYCRMRTEELIKVTQEEAEKLRKEEVLGW